jgi:hypothetical protein
VQWLAGNSLAQLLYSWRNQAFDITNLNRLLTVKSLIEAIIFCGASRKKCKYQYPFHARMITLNKSSQQHKVGKAAMQKNHA